MSEQLCDECIQELKDDAEFMLQILCTPNLAEHNIELANDVLHGTLRELYGVCDCEEDENTHEYTDTSGGQGVTVTYTTGPTNIVDDLAKVLKEHLK